MNPFFFGASERPLFGLYTHGKQQASAPSTSVLLCYPIGAEYMRAHRAFRQLNNLLNRAGMNVLRFDYSCTGDSSGDTADASLQDWLEDIDWAVQELKDNAMTDTVSVVGLRWGATLAALACSTRSDVDHLLLWDPILDGRCYFDELLGSSRPSECVGVEGYPFMPTLIADLEAVDLRKTLEGTQMSKISMLVSQELPQYRELSTILSSRGREDHYEVVPSSGNWAQADPFGDALIPQNIIQAIVDRL